MLLAAAACAAGIALGNWQSRRAEEKRVVLPRATVQGEFLPRYTVYLDNKLNHGRLGYEVITPLRLKSGASVLVNRGWIAAGPTREVLPQVRTPPGEITLSGVVREHLPRVLQAGPASRGPVRQNLEIEDFAAETGLTLRPFVIEQHSFADDGLLRDWPAAGPGPEKNEMYALQWYSLAGLSVVLLVVLSIRKREG